MNIAFLGAGAWGTALAASVAARQPALLWVRDAAQCAAMRATRRNERYLPGIDLPPALTVTDDFDAALAHARGGLAIIATPMSGLAATLERMPERAAQAPGLLWLCKGFEQASGRLAHEVAHDVRPALARVGVLSGPSFAIEVARGQATALVVASRDASLREAAVAALHGLCHGALRSFQFRWRIGQHALRSLGVGQHGSQRLVQLVRHTSRQFTQCVESGHLPQSQQFFSAATCIPLTHQI